jgi:hypothetical protein
MMNCDPALQSLSKASLGQSSTRSWKQLRTVDMAGQQHAGPSAAWRTALKSLQVIPQAAADKSLPKEGLYFLASQAEVDITLALYPAAGAFDLTPQQFCTSKNMAMPAAEGATSV